MAYDGIAIFVKHRKQVPNAASVYTDKNQPYF